VNTITETGARIMVQALVRSFVDQTLLEESSNEWVARALKTQQMLGRILGVTPAHYDIEELVTSFEELQSVEAGTHTDLKRNATYTVDNSLELTEHLLRRINQETTALLTNAGFGKKVAA
jgi:phosphoserine phosphatase